MSDSDSDSTAYPEKLLSRARTGDRQALDGLLNMYRNYLYVMAGSQIGNELQVRLDPSDLVQETMLEAYRDFAGFVGRSERELISWLRKILVRNMADQVRRHQSGKRDVRRQQSLEELIDRSSINFETILATGAGGESSPSQQAAHRESVVILADALTKLPPDYQQVIIMRHLSGIQFNEIASRMGRSSGAVRMLWTRALERLHNELERPT